FSGPRTKPTPRLRAHGAVAYSTDEEPPAPFAPQGGEEGSLTDGGAMDAAVASSVDVEADSPEVVAAREAGLPVLDRDEDGLRALGQILGEDVPLVARTDLRMPSDLALTGSGAIRCDGLTYPSIEILFSARGIADYDGWNELYLGDRLGPTLAESLAEINREIMREYADAPVHRGPARH
ncbi:MAG: cell division topological specificity factor, partial [Schaalia georgiae]|nr:cell division topological specificity factor [Schaalia georgiae]